jgi:hypothetical protein
MARSSRVLNTLNDLSDIGISSSLNFDDVSTTLLTRQQIAAQGIPMVKAAMPR